MTDIQETLRTLPAVNTRPKNLIGALLMSLALQACASTELSQPVKPIIVNQDCPRLEIETSLLDIRPLTPVSPIQTNGSLEDAVEIIAADHRRDRGQLIELSAAEKQRAQDQDVLDEQCQKAADAQAKAIEKANEETVEIKRPFWSGLF